MTVIIFTKLLKMLDASMGVQSRRISVFMDICATHLQHTSFQRNAKVAYYPPDCLNMFGHHEMCQTLLQEAPSTSCALHRLRKGHQVKKQWSASNIFHSSGLPKTHAVHNCYISFCQCGCGREHNTEADSEVLKKRMIHSMRTGLGLMLWRLSTSVHMPL